MSDRIQMTLRLYPETERNLQFLTVRLNAKSKNDAIEKLINDRTRRYTDKHQRDVKQDAILAKLDALMSLLESALAEHGY